MKSQSSLSLIQAADALIKGGRIAAAKELFNDFEVKKVPRSEVAAVAAVARRLELYPLALRLLNPIVRSTEKKVIATVDEKLEYGTLLMKIGSLAEARRILESLDPKARPEALLFLAMSYFGEWEYGTAIPLLERYVASPNLTDYRRLVGKVNLAQSLICEGIQDKAKAVLEQVKQDASDLEATLLYTNGLELSAQLSFDLGDFNGARSLLHEARSLVQGTSSVSELLIRKWLAVCESYETGKLAPALAEIREEAIKKEIWEVVRDCDFHEAVVSRDEALLSHCYFGTPFFTYRQKIQKAAPWFRIPSFYTLAAAPMRGSRVFDLEMVALETDPGEFEAVETIPIGSSLHEFFILLCRDFYRPVNVVTAFSFLAPDEYFNPKTSPGRVHQLANRLRAAFDAEEFPLELNAVEGGYRLVVFDGIGLKLPRDPLPTDKQDLMFRKLRRVLAKDEFTAKEARACLDVSFGTANSLLKWAVEQGRLDKSGASTTTRYRIK